MVESEANRVRDLERTHAALAQQPPSTEVAERLNEIRSNLQHALAELEDAARKRREALQRIAELHGIEFDDAASGEGPGPS
jgi:ABC-type transporter Mla subunit MlaD